MDSIPKPSIDGYRQLVVACANDYTQCRTAPRKERILASVDAIEDLASVYDALANRGALEKLGIHSVCGSADKDDLVDLYTTKFVPVGRPGRSRYLSIRQSAPNGRCPLCSQLPVSTVDHYLPKARYPGLAVFPRNLVPACGRCNECKLAESSALTLHPYYDAVQAIRWLKCVLLDGNTVSVSFDVWEDVEPSSLRQRMLNHLEYVGVGDLYRASALSHLCDIRQRLTDMGDAGGPEAVREYLQEELESRCAYRLNSWGTALYSALSTEEWFIQGGYVRIETD